MNKRIFITGFALAAMVFFGLNLNGYAQKRATYTASNGMVYAVGDTLVLGVGSAPDGNFNHIYSSMALTIFASLADETDFDFRLPEFFHGAPVVIRKIRDREEGTLFMFDTDGWGGFVIDVEQAIAACEISYCRPHGYLTQEEFEKLILLYRAAADGDISNERFEELRLELMEVNTAPSEQ